MAIVLRSLFEIQFISPEKHAEIRGELYFVGIITECFSYSSAYFDQVFLHKMYITVVWMGFPEANQIQVQIRSHLQHDRKYIFASFRIYTLSYQHKRACIAP
jgi:hypothetical protein